MRHLESVSSRAMNQLLWLMKFKNWFIDSSIMQRKVSVACQNMFQATRSHIYREKHARAIVVHVMTSADEQSCGVDNVSTFNCKGLICMIILCGAFLQNNVDRFLKNCLFFENIL